jgi:2'-5' RNA ligase
MEQGIRAFIAIKLPDRVTERLQALQDRLKKRDAFSPVRWVQASSIHLTLKFLGQIPVEAAEAVTIALELACDPIPPFSLTVEEIGCFPNTHRPRVIWVGVAEPTGALAWLQRATEDACEQLGFRRERRPYHPHLTLGRIRDRTTLSQRIAIGQAIQEEEVVPSCPVTVSGIDLIRSTLRPAGAMYTSLGEIGLGGE